MQILIKIIILGVGATAIMDMLGHVRNILLGIKSLDYSIVGRWILSWHDRKFFHPNIWASPKKRQEKTVGWLAHYLIGVIWVSILIFVQNSWLDKPDFISAMILAAITSLFPFLLMQPAFGLGLFACKTTRPIKSIINTLISHFFFGVGIFFTGKLFYWINHYLS
ncbi:DUF2938 family protein [Neisseria sp. Ec49-e6-T10]|uniref:DUF2938 family protein n=1 Tax=Neisseria sp. Ec49-e6-T10 TaxID=3140744 RepID=UPI003EBDFB3F